MVTHHAYSKKIEKWRKNEQKNERKRSKKKKQKVEKTGKNFWAKVKKNEKTFSEFSD